MSGLSKRERDSAAGWAALWAVLSVAEIALLIARSVDGTASFLNWLGTAVAVGFLVWNVRRAQSG